MNFSKHRRWSSILALISFCLILVPVISFAADGGGGGLPLPPIPPADVPAQQSGPPMPSDDQLAAGVKAANAARAEEAAAAAKESKGNDNAEPECKSAASTARSLCNTMSMVGIDDPAQGAMMEMMLSQAMGMASQIQNAGANGSQQCSNQSKLAELMAGINALKAAACAFGQNRCESNCKTDGIKKKIADAKAAPGGPETGKVPELEKTLEANQKHANTCKQYSINTMMAAMQAVKFGGSMLQSQSCAKALAQVQAPPGSYLPPGVTLPVGATDCSDPTMASSNVTCICAANPASPICGNGNGGSQLAGGGGGTQLTGPGGAPRPYAPTSGPDGVTPTGLGSPAPSTGANVGQQGGGGGGGIGGGNGGAPGGGGGEDPGGAPVDKQSMIGGVSGGGGGGGSGVAGNPYGSGGKGEGDKGFFDKFNLSKFLPSKKNFGSRGLAGMSLQSKDGITGPMGPSLWEKVTNQYQVQKPKMIQDR